MIIKWGDNEGASEEAHDRNTLAIGDERNNKYIYAPEKGS